MPLLTSVLIACARAQEFAEQSDFDAAWSCIRDNLNRVGEFNGLDKAHLLLCAGTLAARTRCEAHLKVEGWLKESLRIFENHGECRNAAMACYGLALNCKTSGVFREAHGWLDDARRRIPEDDTESVCRIEVLRGILFEDEGSLDEALSTYISISPLIEGVSAPNFKAKFHGELAIIKRKLATAENRPEYFDDALLEYTAAAYHHEQAGDRRSEAIVKANAAFLRFKLGRLDEALDDVNEAILIYQELRDRPYLAQARETKAQILLAQGRNEEAEIEARESVSLLKIGGERALLVESSITHGRALARCSERLRAFNAFQAAQDVSEFIGYKEGLGLTSLALLEEMADLDLDTRRHHHKIILGNLDLRKDAEMSARYKECVRATVELFKEEMSGGREIGNVFTQDFSLDEAVRAFERLLIEQALEEAGGCQKQAARLLGISPSNLNFKLKSQHKAAKHLQTYGHYRGVKPMSHLDVKTMPSDALSDLGVSEGDKLVIKSGCRISRHDVVLIRSRKKFYVGLYEQEAAGATLAPANSEYETLYFDEGDFEIAGKVVGYIKRAEAGTKGASIKTLIGAASAAR